MDRPGVTRSCSILGGVVLGRPDGGEGWTVGWAKARPKNSVALRVQRSAVPTRQRRNKPRYRRVGTARAFERMTTGSVGSRAPLPTLRGVHQLGELAARVEHARLHRGLGRADDLRDVL